jgi:hypothetical protein
VWVALEPACGPTTTPSPKSKRYDAIGVESVSVDADASAVTFRGAFPEVGDTDSLAAGGLSLGLTVTWAVAVDDCPAVSVTVTVTV